MPPLFVLGIAEFVRGALVLSILPIYGKYTAGFNMDIIGTAISLQYLLDNLFRIPSGWISDLYGGKLLLIIGIILLACGVCLIYDNSNITVFYLGAVIFGLGFTPVWPVAVATITSQIPATQIGETLSTVFMAWLVGSGLGPVTVNFIIERSYHIAFGIILMLLLIALFIAIMGDFPPVINNKELPPCWLSLNKILHEAVTFKVVYPGVIMQTMSLGILGPIITIFARVAFGLSTSQFNLFIVGGGIFTVAFLIPIGRLTDRLGFKVPLIGGLLLAAIGLMLLPLQKTVAHALIASAFIGIAYAFILPSWNGVLGRAISPDKRGTMWALFMTLEGLGMAAGSFVGGKVWENYGHTAPFFVSSFILIAMAVFYTINNLETLAEVNEDN